jgi:hypothetical protein
MTLKLYSLKFFNLNNEWCNIQINSGLLNLKRLFLVTSIISVEIYLLKYGPKNLILRLLKKIEKINENPICLDQQAQESIMFEFEFMCFYRERPFRSTTLIFARAIIRYI